MNRRRFFQAGGAMTWAALSDTYSQTSDQAGEQRLSLSRLREWESLGYGMFIHFGMSTFLGEELPDGTAPSTAYAPDKLDVDQWVSVARDAGMRYAVLTAKHVAGHCLWPTRCCDYHVGTSSNPTDVVEAFVRACEKRHVLPGLYYCSWDNHNRFGSRTPSDGGDWNGQNDFPRRPESPLPPFTTSLYHHFMIAQIEELLKNYDPIMELWIDIPGVLGRGFRTFLYNHIAVLQPNIVIMMNSGIGDGTDYNTAYAWPSDLIAIERERPPEPRHNPWRTVEGRRVYLPAEHCDPIGREWFWVEGDMPRSDGELLTQFHQCRERGVNFLLNVPPDRHGLIPRPHIDALLRLRRAAGI